MISEVGLSESILREAVSSKLEITLMASSSIKRTVDRIQ